MATRQGLRFLAKIYQNLSPTLLQRSSNQPVPKETTAPINQVQSSKGIDIESRLQNIEALLNTIIKQRRVRTVERDADDLIVRIVDSPAEEAQ